MAGGADLGGDDDIIEGINVTPLVDIMLVLLIIFMVAARLEDATAVPLRVPEAESTAVVEDPLTLSVPVEGPMESEGATFSDPAAAAAAVAGRWQARPERPVVIRADGGVEHRRVLALLGALQKEGIDNIAFAADPAGAGAPTVAHGRSSGTGGEARGADGAGNPLAEAETAR